jgi:HSP90 family molecular chaperone
MNNTEIPEGLYLTFHGRIIDSLGIQMYQSPVAAIAELISNAWDADATEVYVELPETLDGDAVVKIRDNGSGMTFAECQRAYLNVGRDRRAEGKGQSNLKLRPVLGRKGIGKFAGFGIAQVLTLETTSRETGEHTKFALDLAKLRGEDYVLIFTEI